MNVSVRSIRRPRHVEKKLALEALEQRNMLAGDVYFATPGRVDVGDGPGSVLTVDLNHDQHLDLIIANSGSQDVAILLGQQDRSFRGPIRYGVNFHAGSLAAGDLNDDGHLDVLVGNATTNHVSALVGRGDGTFDSPIAVFTGRSDIQTGSGALGSLALGDFDNDGHLDLAFARNNHDNVFVSLGNGDGTFGRPTVLDAGASPSSIAIDDLNGDELLDLVIANYGNGSTGLVYKDSGISVLYGIGMGRFSKRVSFTHSPGAPYHSVSINDFDRDGAPDLMVSIPRGNLAGTVVLLNDGSGQFPTETHYQSGLWPYFATTVDVNGDGQVDLVTANSKDGTVWIRQGNGDGTFGKESIYLAGASPGSITFGDFDGDRSLDMVVANGASDDLSIIYGTASGTLAGEPRYPTDIGPDSVAAGDFNGDDILDLAVATAFRKARIFLGNGDGTYREGERVWVGSSSKSLQAIDLDSDNDLDLVTVNEYSDDLSVLLNNGDATFVSQGGISLSDRPRDAILDDFDQDNLLDVAVVHSDYVRDTRMWNWELLVLVGSGDGTFSYVASRLAGDGEVRALAGGDVDGDGLADIALLTGQEVRILHGNGDGSFDETEQYAIGPASYSVELADFDNDGELDLAVGQYGSIGLFLGYGDGSFYRLESYKPMFARIGSIRSLKVTDLDGDGNLDAVLASERPSRVYVFFGPGDGSLVFQRSYAAGHNPWDIAIGDLDRDGDADLAVVNWNSSDLSILLNRADGMGVLAGDANKDWEFNRTDILLVLQRGKYRSDATASWFDGDWNGDRSFNQLDIVAALQTGNYLHGSAALTMAKGNDTQEATIDELPVAEVDALFAV